MSHEYVYKISSRYLQKWLRFGTLPWVSDFCFLTDFDASKSVLGHCSRSLRKSDLKTCIAALNHDFFVWPFSPGDLRWPWPVLWSQSTENDAYRCQWTIHADSLALFALNIEILLADVTKPEKSKILTLTIPVTSSVTSGSSVWPCTGSSRTLQKVRKKLSNGVSNLEIGPVVWEISGGSL